MEDTGRGAGWDGEDRESFKFEILIRHLRGNANKSGIEKRGQD